MKWQGKAEEAFYVAKGSIEVTWDDGQGDSDRSPSLTAPIIARIVALDTPWTPQPPDGI